MTHPWDNHNDSCECHITICSECGCTNEWPEVPGVPTTSDVRRWKIKATYGSVYLAFKGGLSGEGQTHWWASRNRLLGNRTPQQALEAGDFDEVARAAESFAEGDYI